MSEPLSWTAVALPDRIAKYLDKVPGAVAGQHGHDQTFKVACALVWGFALPLEEALAYLRIYNQKCEPPWSEKELKHKVSSALSVRHTKPIGHLL